MKRILLFAAFFAFGASLMAQTINLEDINQTFDRDYEIVNANEGVNRAKEFLNTTCKEGKVTLYVKSDPLLRSTNAAPTALYGRPNGSFYVGLSDTYLQLSAKRIFGPAYAESTWVNMSTNATSYSWSVQDPYSSKQITLTDTDAKLYYPNGTYSMPKLTAKGSSSAAYTWASKNTAGREIKIGGHTFWDVSGVATAFGSTTYDPMCPKVYHLRSADEKDFSYGTTNDNTIISIGNIFEKPARKYRVYGSYISLAFFEAPAATQFKLIFHKIDEDGNPTEEIATATCKASDVITSGSGKDIAYTLPFRNGFVKKGQTKASEYIDIDEAVLVELTGFNSNSKITLAAFSQEFNTSPSQTIAHARVLVHENSKKGWTYYTESDGKTPRMTSLLFHLEAVYTYFNSKNGDTEFKVYKGGGEKTFDVATFYSPSLWKLDTKLPSWLTYKVTHNTTTGDATITFTAKALPANLNERTASVQFSSEGDVLTFNFDQNLDNSSITENEATSKVKVVYRDDAFELSYPVEYNSVSVYNISGQLVDNYKLPSDGIYSISTGDLAKGIYFLKFSGSSLGETVKAIK